MTFDPLGRRVQELVVLMVVEHRLWFRVTQEDGEAAREATLLPPHLTLVTQARDLMRFPEIRGRETRVCQSGQSGMQSWVVEPKIRTDKDSRG